MLYCTETFAQKQKNKREIKREIKLMGERDQKHRIFLTYHTYSIQKLDSLTSLNKTEHYNYIVGIQSNFSNLKFKSKYDSINVLQKRLDSLNYNSLLAILSKDINLKRFRLYPLLLHQTQYLYYDKLDSLLLIKVERGRFKKSIYSLLFNAYGRYRRLSETETRTY
jgi:hypothetical protein